MSTKTTVVNLQVPGTNGMQGFVAQPTDTSKKYPGLILFQEAFGVNDHIKDLAQRFAAEGYVVMAPELFHRTAAPGFATGYTDWNAVAEHYSAITTEGIISDAKAAWDWLQQSADVDKDNIASTGYCMGGRASFIANSQLPLKAAVSYYGGGTVQVLDLAPTLHAPMLFFYGGLDTHIPQEQIPQISEALKNAKKDFTNVEFSFAEHGFFCDARSAYNPVAAKDAWPLTLAFIGNRTKA